MAVTTTTSSVRYNGNASTTVFAYTFRILVEPDLVVTIGGALQTLTTHYTVSGVGDAGGGNVTFITAPASGTNNVVFKRVVTNTQPTDYQNGSKFDEDVVETDFDRRTMVSQELSNKLNSSTGQAIQIPVEHTAASFNPTLPDPGLTGTQGKYLKFTSDGLGLEVATVSTDAIANPLTTEGDLLVQGSGTAQRLAIGTADGALLYVNDATSGDLKYSATGPSANQIPESDGTDYTYIYPPDNALLNSTIPFNFGFTATLSTNDLVLTLTSANGSTPSATNPVWFPFRSSTANSGAMTWDKMTATETLTLPSTGTLGAGASEQIRAYVYALRNGADDIELCIARQALWSGDTLQTTTAIDATSDSTTVLYSTTARTTKPIMLVGVIEITSTSTPGQWTTVDNVSVWQPGMRKTGDVVQIVKNSTTNKLTSATITPAIDDSIPTDAEGGALLNVTITPISAINRLYSKVNTVLATASSNHAVVTLFIDSSSAATRTFPTHTSGTNQYKTLIGEYDQLAGGVTSQVWEYRYGGPATTYINFDGASAADDWGATVETIVSVQEVYV